MIRWTGTEECPGCYGSGEDHPMDPEPCEVCGGAGYFRPTESQLEKVGIGLFLLVAFITGVTMVATYLIGR